MAGPRARINRHFVVRVNKAAREAVRDRVVKLYKDSALRKHRGRSKGGKSVWNRIARFIKGTISTSGVITIRMAHKASALKEFGGIIHAGGPFAEPSAFDGRKGGKIPLAVKGSKRAWGKSLSTDFRRFKFNVPNGSANKLTCIPLSHFTTRGKRSSAKIRKQEKHRVSMIGHMWRWRPDEWDDILESQDYENTSYGSLAEITDPQKRWRDIAERIVDVFAGETGKDLTSRQRSKIRKSVGESTMVVGIRHSRERFEFLYVLVNIAYIRPQKWMPERKKVSDAIEAEVKRLGTL